MHGASQRRVLDLGEVNSTNSVALEAARSGDPGPLWVTARRQTKGRGRQGREWISVDGNLYASLLLLDPAPIGELARMPLVAAVGVRSALARLCDRTHVKVAIKWPNDILLNGDKAVGILLESERLPDGRLAVVTGCGINVAGGPNDNPYPVTSLRQQGVDVSFEAVFASLAEGVEQAYARWNGGRNFAATREEWLRNAVGIGGPIRVTLSDRSIEGIFETLDEDGRIVLIAEDGNRRRISAGDIFLLGASEAAGGPSRRDLLREEGAQP